jgi:hypothetical protein
VIGTQLQVVQTKVCRNQNEGLDTSETCKQAMLEKGWVEALYGERPNGGSPRAPKAPG